MIILDTDILSILDSEVGQAYETLLSRLSLPGVDEVATTIISFEEQIRGWLAIISNARKPNALLRGYERLHATLRAYQRRPVLDFDDAAVRQFDSLRKSVRIGTMDLRIAAIALTHDAVVVSRNLADFRQVPSLRVEDWTRPL